MAKYYCSYVFECRRKGLSCIGVSGVDHTGWMHECSTAKKTDRKSFTEFEYLVRKTLEEEGKNDIQRTLRRKESSKKVSKDYGKKMHIPTRQELLAELREKEQLKEINTLEV